MNNPSPLPEAYPEKIVKISVDVNTGDVGKAVNLMFDNGVRTTDKNNKVLAVVVGLVHREYYVDDINDTRQQFLEILNNCGFGAPRILYLSGANGFAAIEKAKENDEKRKKKGL